MVAETVYILYQKSRDKLSSRIIYLLLLWQLHSTHYPLKSYFSGNVTSSNI